MKRDKNETVFAMQFSFLLDLPVLFKTASIQIVTLLSKYDWYNLIKKTNKQKKQ